MCIFLLLLSSKITQCIILALCTSIERQVVPLLSIGCLYRFKEKFEEFFHDAEKDIALLETEFDMMQKKYEHVAELFTFDVNKYSQEEFFRDINKFIVSYKTAKEQIVKEEDKRRRDQEARERAEREKAERAERDTRQRALHDVTNDQSNTEVMDQLVQLINTGQAFDVMGAGRRRRPGKTTG
ncbi:Protein diaphanous [Portunus trituberculatus]|uniref:Protein diaphanous n=1 Tax=Portunus trituberculatus TaxID=210409 RepID=A0A5B7JJU9_PORTR|nr:Protein diaphanous [Portunus trituberculatus]